MIKNFFQYFVIAISLLFLTGCATLYNPATRRNEFIFIDSQTEVAIGKNVIHKFLKKHPLSNDLNSQARVETVGRRITQVSDRKDLEYRFSVLQDKELNALTLPGGFIYINEGLLDLFNDDELAFVLAHEVGHVAARHIAKKLQANLGYQILLTVAFAGLGADGGDTTVDIARGVDAIYNLIELGYSRKDEYGADRLGVKYVMKAGFDPQASLSSLEKIKKQEGQNWKILGYFRTHPFVDGRINALKVIIPELQKQ